MSGLRSVFKSDGSLHFENEIGTGTVRTRMDLSTGEVSTVISSGPMNTVTSNNGSHFEYTVGTCALTPRRERLTICCSLTSRGGVR